MNYILIAGFRLSLACVAVIFVIVSSSDFVAQQDRVSSSDQQQTEKSEQHLAGETGGELEVAGDGAQEESPVESPEEKCSGMLNISRVVLINSTSKTRAKAPQDEKKDEKKDETDQPAESNTVSSLSDSEGTEEAGMPAGADLGSGVRTSATDAALAESKKEKKKTEKKTVSTPAATPKNYAYYSASFTADKTKVKLNIADIVSTKNLKISSVKGKDGKDPECITVTKEKAETDCELVFRKEVPAWKVSYHLDVAPDLNGQLTARILLSNSSGLDWSDDCIVEFVEDDRSFEITCSLKNKESCLYEVPGLKNSITVLHQILFDANLHADDNTPRHTLLIPRDEWVRFKERVAGKVRVNFAAGADKIRGSVDWSGSQTYSIDKKDFVALSFAKAADVNVKVDGKAPVGTTVRPYHVEQIAFGAVSFYSGNAWQFKIENTSNVEYDIYVVPVKRSAKEWAAPDGVITRGNRSTLVEVPDPRTHSAIELKTHAGEKFSFKLFERRPRDEDALSSRSIHDLAFEERKGLVWGTANDLQFLKTYSEERQKIVDARQKVMFLDKQLKLLQAALNRWEIKGSVPTNSHVRNELASTISRAKQQFNQESLALKTAIDQLELFILAYQSAEPAPPARVSSFTKTTLLYGTLDDN